MGSTESNASGFAPDRDQTENGFDPLIDDFVAKDRNYTHFDLKLSDEVRTTFNMTDREIASHDFWPLLGFTKVQRRIKYTPERGRYFEEKPREIKFGSHKDAAVLEYYASHLSTAYERYLCETDFGHSILAYRTGVGDNIAQAGALFRELRDRGSGTAIALDISGFFDNIDHDVMFATLKKVLGTSRLSQSDFHVFRTMTKFAWVDVDALAERLGRKHSVAGRLCTSREFRNVVRRSGESIVISNPNQFGIPQGTPLSGLYANIAMLEFDRIISNYIKRRGGSYRRYSDDIAIVIPPHVDVVLVMRHVKRQLKKSGLSLSEHKIELSVFTETNNDQKADRPFQYLGFTYDGQRTLIRASSLSRYYTKMSAGIRAKIRAAYEQDVPSGQIYMRELYRRYTHFGKTRNFPRYAYRAAKILNAPEIRGQLRTHLPKFRNKVNYYVNRAYGVSAGNELESGPNNEAAA